MFLFLIEQNENSKHFHSPLFIVHIKKIYGNFPGLEHSAMEIHFDPYGIK
jgi:hypothetical protein